MGRAGRGRDPRRRLRPVALRLPRPPTRWSRCCATWRRIRATPQPFEATLPIMGVDGTLERRLRGTRVEGRVHAKTGSDVQRARAGRLRDDDGAASASPSPIVANNFKARGSAIDAVVDRALDALVGMDALLRVPVRRVASAARRAHVISRRSRRARPRGCASAGASSPPPCARSGRPPPLPPKRPASVLNSADGVQRRRRALRATTAIAGRASRHEHRSQAGLGRRSATASALSALPSAPRNNRQHGPAGRRWVRRMRPAPRPGSRPARPAASRCDRREVARLFLQRGRWPRTARAAAPTAAGSPPSRCRAARGTWSSVRPPQDELQARAALEPLPAAHRDQPDLAGVRDVGAAAGGQIPAGDVDDAQLAARASAPCAAAAPPPPRPRTKRIVTGRCSRTITRWRRPRRRRSRPA